MDEDTLKLKQRDCKVSTCVLLELIRHVCTQTIHQRVRPEKDLEEI